MKRNLNKMQTCICIESLDVKDSRYGEAHLIEHILINQLPKLFSYGYTTEDYILLCSPLKLSLKQVVQKLATFEIDNSVFMQEKTKILEEIYHKPTGWIFLDLSWEDTIYNSCPMGTREFISTADKEEIEKKIRGIPNQRYISSNLEPQLPHRPSADIMENKEITSKYFIFETYNYKSLRWTNRNRDALYLVHQYVALHTPKLSPIIQEKRFITNLVWKVQPLIINKQLKWEKVEKKIKSIEFEIQNDLFSYNINNIESLFFHNLTWEQRVGQLLDHSNKERAESIIWEVYSNQKDKKDEYDHGVRRYR